MQSISTKWLFNVVIIVVIIALTACNKDEGDPPVDINSFPLSLPLIGYSDRNIDTYIGGTLQASSDMAFNQDDYFTSNQKARLCDEIIFQSANSVSLVKLFGDNVLSFNENFDSCTATYLVDSTQITLAPNANFPNGYTQNFGGDRNELRLLYWASKISKNVGGQQVLSYGAFPASQPYQPLINDLSPNDTLSIETYTLVYRP